MQLLWSTPLFHNRFKSTFRFTILPICVTWSPRPITQPWWMPAVETGSLRGHIHPMRCGMKGGVLVNRWHPLGKEGSRWEGATKVLLACELSGEVGWPCVHPLAQEKIAFSPSNILFISNAFSCCCIPA